MKEENNIAPCVGALDYKAEYERILMFNAELNDMVSKLTCENEHLKATLSNVTRNSEIMAAQLDIIHLIYGGNRNG